MKIKTLGTFFFSLCSLALTQPNFSLASDLKSKLPLSRVTTVTVNNKLVYCALFHGRTNWLVAKRVKGSTYKKINGTKAQRSACANVSNLGEVTLADLPSADSLVGEQNVSGGHLTAYTLSGTPPALPEIPDLAIKSLFWRPGVVDGINSGTPTAGQCSELFSPATDGESGGFNACYLSQGVGYAFETVLKSGTSLCYMKGAFTPSTLSVGAITLLSGAFPANNVTKLFATPTGSTARIVQVDAGGGEQTSKIFLRIYDASTNARTGDTYRFDFWSCEGDAVREIENTRITRAGLYQSTSYDNSGGSSFSFVSAHLRRNAGELVFDTSQLRVAESTSIRPDESGQFKSYLTIDGSNVIRNKEYSVFSGITNKTYSIARVSGDSVADLRFLEGAYKDSFVRPGFESASHEGGIEYRDTYYAAAPSNPYIGQLSEVSFTGDSFYASLNPVEFDPTGYSCDVASDVHLSLNLGHSVLNPVRAECEGVRLEGMDFCNSDSDVRSASENYYSVCLAH